MIQQIEQPKKNLKIEYRDKHYIILVNYLNNNTNNKIEIVKNKIPEHIANLEKIIPREIIK